jgi:hypothetical protein
MLLKVTKYHARNLNLVVYHEMAKSLSLLRVPVHSLEVLEMCLGYFSGVFWKTIQLKLRFTNWIHNSTAV